MPFVTMLSETNVADPEAIDLITKKRQVEPVNGVHWFMNFIQTGVKTGSFSYGDDEVK